MGFFSFPKDQRILNKRDFVNLNRSGLRRHTKHFVVIFKRNRLGITRLGITATKRTGNAVKRNRLKRLIREFFRLNKSSLPQGYDIVVIARKDASNLDFWKISEELRDILPDRQVSV